MHLDTFIRYPWQYGWTLLFLSLACRAQFPPPVSDETLTTIQSPIDPKITVSYKTPPVGTCSTVFATQKQYSGYITLPPNILIPSVGNYTINTFFWFFEARQTPQTAPLTIFINGGPGSSSMVGLFQEVGPCQVVELNQTTLGTTAREWGWDRSSNIIFIDQPVQVGFSYDTLTNVSVNLLDDSTTQPPTTIPVTQPSYTFLNGTLSSGNTLTTANTTQIAAQSVWHFLQAFLSTFPQYNPGLQASGESATGAVGVNLFTESYGGKYGPAFAAFFETQNNRRLSDVAFASSTLEVGLRSLGIINGWIDLLTQAPFAPRFAFNNTYGFQAISQVQELNALSAYSGANGCQQMTSLCRAQESNLDPYGNGNAPLANEACSAAQVDCENNVIGPYTLSGHSVYDISQNLLDPFPDSHYLEYLNTLAVQEAIGTPVNYTQDSPAVVSAFEATGDWARNGILADVVGLLTAGVRVALIYGDRDYICNWAGGEAVSYAIAGAAGPAYLPWYAAGYAPIVTNNSYVGGVVREFGNLSFSRIYDAGHLVPAYQPETAFTVFSRIIEGTDISLGNSADPWTYGSFGDANSTHQNTLPTMADPICFVRAVESTCNTDQKNMLANDAGVIINGVLYNSEADWTAPDPSVSSMAGVPGVPPMSMVSSVPHDSGSKAQTSVSTTSARISSTGLPTGVFTATGVPSITSSRAKNEATAMAKMHVFSDTQPAAMVALGFWSFGIFYG